MWVCFIKKMILVFVQLYQNDKNNFQHLYRSVQKFAFFPLPVKNGNDIIK